MKVYHANCFCHPQEFYNKYIRDLYAYYGDIGLTPVLNIGEADIVAICNYIGQQTQINYNDLPKNKIIQYQYEPPATCKTWGKWNDKKIMDNEIKKFYDIERYRTIIQPFYDVKSQAFRECKINNAPRINQMCAIQSLWNTFPNHLIRNQFLEFMHNEDFKYHLFGGLEFTMISKTIDMFKQYVGSVDNKYTILSRYKYALAIENTNENNWFSEKFWDNVMSECLTFYYGCPNLEKFFPAGSFIRLPLPDFNSALKIIEATIDTGQYEKRLPAIREAKRLCLEKYDLLHTIKELV